jgi:alanyl-tRNA synthetase
MRTLTDIRGTFIQYFSDQDHQVVSSSPLVPQNDPTLLFTNAGMVQFKDVFTGLEKRPYQRAVTSQKCLRAGGKHNDLDNVGYTARHHTFFEMLGNFSFGDYFKEQAIFNAWTLITKDFGLAKDKLLVTVYADDEEAAKLWTKIAGLPEDRIIRIATSDNFWSMGDTGPCGPCSEIFYDHGEGIAGGPPGSPEQDGDRFIEIWNLVFMQFEQMADGRRVELPNPSIDTGMGLERIAAVLQGEHNNYNVDLFKTLIANSIELTGADASNQRQSHNVIADHLRACSFLIADGVLPSNEGRGYVLRRIMRRAMRHAHILGAKEPLMWRLVATLSQLMGQAYPELIRAQPLIEQTLKSEEEKFRQTLDRGLKLLNEQISTLPAAKGLPGDVAFKLYDTYGFPLDLTQDVLRESGRFVDTDGFKAAMEVQRAAARSAWSGSGEAANEQVWFDIKDIDGSTEFLGYQTTTAEAVIIALVDSKNAIITEAKAGDKIQILTNQTPFYAESGGQMGDSGLLFSSNGAKVRITDTAKKLGALHAHVAEVLEGTLHLGDAVKLNVDEDRRLRIAANHSATHLLHAALRQCLGEHVTQKGSLVSADRLRFDFTHGKALTANELETIERLINKQIQNNNFVQTQVMPPEQAVGALALFGERYGDEVRVVSMGTDEKSFSKELCGGTHVNRTGDIGFLKIIGESSIASGVRRIEAITGAEVLEYIYQLETSIESERATAKKQILDLNKQVNDIRKKAMSDSDDFAIEKAGEYSIIFKNFQDVAPQDLKPLVDQFKEKLGSGVIVLTSVMEEKISLVVGVTKDLEQKISAVDLVQIGGEILGGSRGGGRPGLAQSGGVIPQNVDKLNLAFSDYLKSI